MASIKVCDPVSVALCVLQELQERGAELRERHQVIERRRGGNERLQHLEETRPSSIKSRRSSFTRCSA
jgi:hypothetical protein